MARDGNDLTRVLLLSGGIDSAALAYWQRPDAALFVDYGQVAAAGERRASTRIASGLRLPWFNLDIDCSSLGSGLLAGAVQVDVAPTPEWWPFRNQLLATIGASWAVRRGFTDVVFGAVAGDGDRHRDGSTWFFNALNTLTSGQEGQISVSAPAIAMTTEELIEVSGIKRSVLGWTFSCHATPFGCGACPGCFKRASAFEPLLSAVAPR
jgi:7-cyano-7-deazaguanine synthase